MFFLCIFTQIPSYIMLKDNALDINDKKSPDTNWRNENISKYGNISFTRSYS